MSKTISLRVTSQYRKASTTLRPSLKTGLTGRRYLSITARTFRAAEARCSYAGTDGIHLDSIPLVDGYGRWQQDSEGNLVAWAL
jgi:hypothetical protein